MASVGLVLRGSRDDPADSTAPPRFRPVLEALAGAGLPAEVVVFADAAVASARDQLLRLEAALVWVDPISDGHDRVQLDALLREVANEGVWVSAHPDLILAMGTKDVLHKTRDVGWGSDVHTYLTVAEFERDFPARLATTGPRVLKQNRGNGGLGVWKVEAVPGSESMVRVQHAQHRSTDTEDLRLGAFMDRCKELFAGGGIVVDQAFQLRIGEGMIRCYLVEDEVVGFARQTHDGLPPGAPSHRTPPVGVLGLPAPKTMYPPGAPEFSRLKAVMESAWVPAMLHQLELDRSALPSLWDADFLYGPKTVSGDDTYVLCEINVSCVTPFPPEAPARIAASVTSHLRQRRR